MGLVPGLNLGLGILGHAGLHAHVLKELLEGVGAVEVLAAGVVALGARPYCRLHVLADIVDRVLAPVLERQMAGNLVEQHGLPVGVPHAVDDGARLAGGGAAREQGAAVRLVAEALAVLVEPDGLGTLERAQRERRVAAHVAARADLDLGADAHGHRDARAVAAAHGRAVGVLAQRVVLGADGVVHLGVAADVTAGQDDRVGVDLHVGAVILLADDAGDLGTVLVVHQAYSLGLIAELRAGLLGNVLRAGEGLRQTHRAAEVGRADVGGEDALAVVVAVHDRPVEADDALLLLVGEVVDEPVEGLARTIGEVAHERGLGAAGAVDLVLVYELGLVVAGHAVDVHLPRGVEVADVVAEDHESILRLRVDDDNLRAELGGLAGAGSPGVAGAADNNLGVDRLGDVGNLGLSAQPVGAQDLAHGLAAVASEVHALASCGGIGGGGVGCSVGCRRLGGDGLGGGDGSGGHACCGEEAAARQGGGQGDGPAHLGQLVDDLFFGGHVLSFPFLGRAAWLPGSPVGGTWLAGRAARRVWIRASPKVGGTFAHGHCLGEGILCKKQDTLGEVRWL